MALINCPECGKEISDTAKSCPNCGYGVRRKDELQNSKICLIMGIISFFIGVFLLWANQHWIVYGICLIILGIPDIIFYKNKTYLIVSGLLYATLSLISLIAIPIPSGKYFVFSVFIIYSLIFLKKGFLHNGENVISVLSSNLHMIFFKPLNAIELYRKTYGKRGIKMDSNYSNNQQGNSQMQPSPPYGQQTQSNNTPQSNGLGIASFVLGVIGFLTGIFVIGILFDVIAIILGIIAIISKKNKNGFAIAGTVLSLVSIILVVFVVNVFDTSDKKESSKKIESAITSEDNVESKEDENSVEQVEKITSYNVGDVVEGKYLKIAYLSCEDYDSDNQFIQPKDGNKFIQLEFEFENIGDSDKHISTFAFNGYADGYNVEKSYTDTDLGASLSTGKKTKGTVTFEVPTDATEISVEYEENSFIGDKIIFTVK